MSRVAEPHLRGLAPGQLSFEETLQRWRAVGDNVSDLTGLRIEPQPIASITCLTELIGRFSKNTVIVPFFTIAMHINQCNVLVSAAFGLSN